MLYDKLKSYKDSGIYPFHMPGHKRNDILNDGLIPYGIDLTEIEDEEKEAKIIKRKTASVKPMDEEEAILQMELLGHQFYLFRNIDTSKEAVIYKRKNGGYGLIEAE